MQPQAEHSIGKPELSQIEQTEKEKEWSPFLGVSAGSVLSASKVLQELVVAVHTGPSLGRAATTSRVSAGML